MFFLLYRKIARQFYLKSTISHFFINSYGFLAALLLLMLIYQLIYKKIVSTIDRGKQNDIIMGLTVQ